MHGRAAHRGKLLLNVTTSRNCDECGAHFVASALLLLPLTIISRDLIIRSADRLGDFVTPISGASQRVDRGSSDAQR
jgi:hypothetical protein